MKRIMFNDQNIRAIDKGIKRVTRRLMNPQPDPNTLYLSPQPCDEDIPDEYKEVRSIDPVVYGDSLKPRYRPGEVVAIQEPYAICSQEFFDMNDTHEVVYYKATTTDPRHFPEKWENKMFMPARCARNYALIQSVRPEQLKKITQEEAELEGCPGWYLPMHPYLGNTDGRTPVEEFVELWESIHGKGSWERDKELWVWRIEFDAILTGILRKIVAIE